MSDECYPRFERIRTKTDKCEDLHRNERLIARKSKKRHQRPCYLAKNMRPKKR